MKLFIKNIFIFNKSLVNLQSSPKLEFSMYSNNLLFDAPFFGQILFQDPATNIMEYMIYFHHDVLFIMVLIFVLIMRFLLIIHLHFTDGWLGKFLQRAHKAHKKVAKKLLNKALGYFNLRQFDWSEEENSDVNYSKSDNGNLQEKFKVYKTPLKYQNHNTLLEIIWTVIPTITLLFIVFPSFALLYLIQPSQWGDFCIKVVGSQWYWTYEYPEFLDESLIKRTPEEEKQHIKEQAEYWTSNLSNLDTKLTPANDHLHFASDINVDQKNLIIESNMVPTEDLALGEFRLLEVDQRLVVPRGTHITFYVTSSDVLHSWSIPSLGIKVDACPGRLNEVGVFIYRTSVFYGQCSEICGILHGFMPIVIQSTDLLQWYKYSYAR